MNPSFRLIYITTPDYWEGEAEVINRLFAEQPLFSLHLRKPESELNDYEQLLSEIHPQYRSRVVLHSHFSLCEKYGCQGIHLNSRENIVPANHRGTISRSCHSVAELQQCNTEHYDYLTLSPIFNSISKQGYNAAFSNAELQQAVADGIINNRTVALGGISYDRLSLVESMGFGGAAMLGDVWKPWHK